MLHRAGVPTRTTRSSPTTPARSRKCDHEGPFDPRSDDRRCKPRSLVMLPGCGDQRADARLAPARRATAAPSKDAVPPTKRGVSHAGARAARRRTSTAATPTAARRCSGRSTKATSPRSKRLLRAGADVKLANNYGVTPMSLAAEVGNTEMLKVLLEAGADADSPESRRADGAAGRGADGQRGSRAGAAQGRRQGRRAGELGRTDAADVGVGAPASGDDAAADLQGRRRQRPLHRSQLPASCDGRGASQEPRQRRTDAAALCRARELHGVRGRAAQEQGRHQPAGSRRRVAAARGDHERQLGPRQAADRRRRRRQPVGHLRRDAAVHGASTCAPASTAAAARRSIR